MSVNTQSQLNRAYEDLSDVIRTLLGIGSSRPKLVEELLHADDRDEREQDAAAARQGEAFPS
jgi:hypothetical protein